MIAEEKEMCLTEAEVQGWSGFGHRLV